MNAEIAPDLNECVFYHSMDLPGLGTVEGQWDLRGRFDEYIGGIDVNGKTFLDVGAASGFLSFEAERRGASVISFDALDYTQHQPVPPTLPDEHFFKRMLAGYDLAHRVLQSKASRIRGNIYALSTFVEKCDVVLVGQILVHLRDPFAALEQAALCSTDYLIIAEGSFEADIPFAQFIGAQVSDAWWTISLEAYRQWLEILGFGVVSARHAYYRCNVPEPTDICVWTIVARRGVTSVMPAHRKRTRKRFRWF
jgi:hypothetical protein